MDLDLEAMSVLQAGAAQRVFLGMLPSTTEGQPSFMALRRMGVPQRIAPRSFVGENLLPFKPGNRAAGIPRLLKGVCICRV